MKHKRSEDAIRFIKEKKNLLIVAAVIAVAVVMGMLSVNYLMEQKQSDAQKEFGEAILSSAGKDAVAEKLRDVSQNHKGSVYATYSLMLLGQHLLEGGEYAEAAIVLDEALKSKQPSAFLTAQILELKATALEFDGSLDDALSAYDKALSVHNAGAYRKNDVLLKSALLNTRMGQTDAAKKQFEEIVGDSSASERILRIAKNELSILEF